MVTLWGERLIALTAFGQPASVLATFLTSLTEHMTESYKGGSLVLVPLGQGKYGGERPHDGMRQTPSLLASPQSRSKEGTSGVHLAFSVM